MLPGLLPTPRVKPAPYAPGTIHTTWEAANTPAGIYNTAWGQAPRHNRVVLQPLAFAGRQLRITTIRSYGVAHMTFGVSAGVFQKPFITQAVPVEFLFSGAAGFSAGGNDPSSLITSDWADYPGLVHASAALVIITDWPSTQPSLWNGWASDEPTSQMWNTKYPTVAVPPLTAPEYNLADPGWTTEQADLANFGSSIAQVRKVEVR